MTTSSFIEQLSNRAGCAASRGVLLAVFCCASIPEATAADWPYARGGEAGTGVAESKLPDAPAKLWEFKVEEAGFEATAVIAGGVVYVGDNEGGLHALKLADGSTVWSKQFEDTGFVTAGAVADGRFYTVDYEGVVRAVNTSDGETAWEFDTESEAYAGPIVHGGALLVTTEGGTLLALDAQSGKERWRFAIDSPLRCSPTIVSTKGAEGHTLLAGCDGKLHAVELASGKEVAAVDIGGPTGSSAAVVAGRAYFGTEQGEFYAVEIQKSDSGQLTGLKALWTYRDPRRGQGIRTSAAVGKRTLVYGSQGKSLYAVNPKNGEPLWQKPMRTKVESSPVIAGNRVVVATGRGELLLLDLKTGDGVWQYEAGGSFIASPAVVEGRVVIGNTDGVLYCFGAAAAEKKGGK